MCGFVGLIGVDSAATVLTMALQAIQHRGQDAAGVATFDGTSFHLVKELGLVTHALPAQRVNQMPGRSGLSHVRYPTVGRNPSREDAQPFITRTPGMLLAHNGNVTNLPEVVEDLRAAGVHVLSSCDAEPILLVLAQELTRIRPANHTSRDVAEAINGVFRRVRGAYSVVAILKVDGRETLLAFRDPHGIRPGVIGKREDGAWMVASESVAMDVAGFRLTGEIPPGSALLLREGDDPVRLNCVPARPRHCVFERIYFARADSVMEDGRVNRQRWRLGRQLAQEWRAKGLQADVVVAVPDTSRPAAMAMAEELGVPNREGFIKNRYTGRTFIMPDEQTRKATLRLKLNPIREMFEGKRVLLVDDSVVRGATMTRIIELLHTLEPKAIHLAIYSPPVRHPCFYGIDMPTKDELMAASFDPDTLEVELAKRMGADSVTFLSHKGLRQVAGDEICAACFDGDYVVPVSRAERAEISEDRRGS